MKQIDATPLALAETLDRIESATDLNVILEALKAFTTRFGLPYIFISQFLNPARELPETWLRIDNWPPDLIKARRETGALAHDPTVRMALNAQHKFSWKEAAANSDAAGRAVIKQAQAYKLCEGYMFPVRSAGIPPGAVSIGGEKSTASRSDLHALEIASNYAYIRMIHVAGLGEGPKIEKLSRREAEILTFIAEGHSNEKTAAILNISKDAVKDTLKRCYRKLQATNRAEAVTRALQTSQIYPFTEQIPPKG